MNASLSLLREPRSRPAGLLSRPPICFFMGSERGPKMKPIALGSRINRRILLSTLVLLPALSGTLAGVLTCYHF
jgi:hypothetical protein